MSLEVNVNSTLSSKRRKHREKHNGSTAKSFSGDFNIPNYPNFHNTISSFPNSNIPEHAPYYFPVTYPHVTTEPMSLPVYPVAYPTMPYPPNANMHSRNYNVNATNNKFTHSPINNNDANEYMSLPIGSIDQNEYSSDKRRFSDPGVPFDSDSSANSLDDRLIHKLTQQVNTLKENNRKLARELSEIRIELNMLKQQQSMRHFDRDYEPGMLAEVIKEIRDAARVREDALLAKVKHMIEEKQFDMNQLHVLTDKTRNNERLTKLEDQMKNLNVSNHHRSDDNVSLPSSSNIDENSNAARQVIELEREALVLRRELQDARAKKEESDQKLIQLDKRLSHLIRQKDVVQSDLSEDGKTSASADTFSLTTMSSGLHVIPHSVPQRITLTGPVTDL